MATILTLGDTPVKPIYTRGESNHTYEYSAAAYKIKQMIIQR